MRYYYFILTIINNPNLQSFNIKNIKSKQCMYTFTIFNTDKSIESLFIFNYIFNLFKCIDYITIQKWF